MDIRFECTNCSQRISAAPDQIGTSANCPACGQCIMVPNPLAAVTVPLPQGRSPVSRPSTRSENALLKLIRSSYSILLVCVSVYFYQDQQLRKISVEYVANAGMLKQMESGDYFLGVAFESIVRGSNGDPLGKANEELFKRNLLEARQVEILQTVRGICGWELLCGLVGLITACYILYHWLKSLFARTMKRA